MCSPDMCMQVGVDHFSSVTPLQQSRSHDMTIDGSNIGMAVEWCMALPTFLTSRLWSRRTRRLDKISSTEDLDLAESQCIVISRLALDTSDVLLVVYETIASI